jgi:hypothetical protein
MAGQSGIDAHLVQNNSMTEFGLCPSTALEL